MTSRAPSSLDDRVEQHRAGDDEVGAPGVEAGELQPRCHVERDDLLARPVQLLCRDAAVVDRCRRSNTLRPLMRDLRQAQARARGGDDASRSRRR